MSEKNSAYMKQLDGLRALCVAAVAWSHWAPLFGISVEHFPGAEIGVEVFFVISGFLITGILLDNHSEEHRSLVLRQFYVRRFLRIFPVYYVTLALAGLLGLSAVTARWNWHFSYLSNIYFYMHGWDGAVSHFWSLAVEEQFYVFWPVFIFMVPRKFLLPVLTLLMVAAPVYAVWMSVAHPGPSRVTASVLMPSCLSALGMGALLAHLTRTSARLPQVMRLLLVAGALGLASWLVAGSPAWIKPLARLSEDLVFGWLVFAVAGGLRGPIGKFLQCAPISYLGRISYGIYVIHGFAMPLVRGATGRLGHDGFWEWLHHRPLIGLTLFAAITIGLASLSWHLYEKRLNHLKRFFPYPEE